VAGASLGLFGEVSGEVDAERWQIFQTLFVSGVLTGGFVGLVYPACRSRARATLLGAWLGASISTFVGYLIPPLRARLGLVVVAGTILAAAVSILLLFPADAPPPDSA
jgi:hypothetical protein